MFLWYIVKAQGFFQTDQQNWAKPDLKNIRKRKKNHSKYLKNLMLLLVFVLSYPFWYDGLLKEGCRALLHFAATLCLSLFPAHT